LIGITGKEVSQAMGIEKIDITGLHSTKAVFKIAAKTVAMHTGDVLEVTGFSQAFKKDISSLCEKIKRKPLFSTTGDTGMMKCQIFFSA
jgi:TusA-related sulfurtransferase